MLVIAIVRVRANLDRSTGICISLPAVDRLTLTRSLQS